MPERPQSSNSRDLLTPTEMPQVENIPWWSKNILRRGGGKRAFEGQNILNIKNK